MKVYKAKLPPLNYTSWIHVPIEQYQGWSKEAIVNDLKEKFFEQQFIDPLWNEVEIDVVEVDEDGGETFIDDSEI